MFHPNFKEIPVLHQLQSGWIKEIMKWMGTHIDITWNGLWVNIMDGSLLYSISKMGRSDMANGES